METNFTWPGWDVVRKIGSGSFGNVYEIQRDMFGNVEKAALKVISIPHNVDEIDDYRSQGYTDKDITQHYHQCLQQIVNEYSLMAKIKGHSNVVSCDDVQYVAQENGVGWDIFIKMELLSPLMKSLDKVTSEEQIVRLGIDICNALKLCRERNIIHRDIKPQNIFISDSGSFKLGDFGIAKTVERTTGGTRVGTYKYMAPEVYNNQPYGTAADIYSLGLVLYWLLNEKRTPFLPMPPQMPTATMEEEAGLRRFRGERIPEPRYGSPALKRIVLKACAYSPADRYTNAVDMMADLQALSGVSSTQIVGTPNPVPAVEPSVGKSILPPTPAPVRPVAPTGTTLMSGYDAPAVSGTTLMEASVAPAKTPAPNYAASVAPAKTPVPNYAASVAPAKTPAPNYAASVAPAKTPAPNYAASVAPAKTPASNYSASVAPAKTPIPNYTASVAPAKTPVTPPPAYKAPEDMVIPSYESFVKELGETEPQKSKKGLVIGLIAVIATCIGIGVGVLLFNLFFTGQYSQAVENYIDVMLNGHSDNVQDLAPGAYFDWTEETHSVDIDDAEQMAETFYIAFIESAERACGEDINVDYEIVSNKEMSQRKLDDIATSLSENYGIRTSKVKKGYTLDVEITVSGEEGSEVIDCEMTVINIDGNWYVIDCSDLDSDAYVHFPPWANIMSPVV